MKDDDVGPFTKAEKQATMRWTSQGSVSPTGAVINDMVSWLTHQHTGMWGAPAKPSPDLQDAIRVAAISKPITIEFNLKKDGSSVPIALHSSGCRYKLVEEQD